MSACSSGRCASSSQAFRNKTGSGTANDTLGYATQAKESDVKRRSTAEPVVQLDEVDRRIIGLLRADARRPVADIARQVNLSENGVRKRIDRLLREQAISLTLVPNPGRIGMTSANILISVELPALRRVADAIARLPEVTYLTVTAGTADLLASVLVPAERGLYDFLADRLAAIPGVRSIQTLVTLEVVKLAFELDALVAKDERVPNGSTESAPESP
jgi:Lrp/AsnC family transcriptional regulator for asnA, asnC and gidA